MIIIRRRHGQESAAVPATEIVGDHVGAEARQFKSTLGPDRIRVEVLPAVPVGGVLGHDDAGRIRVTAIGTKGKRRYCGRDVSTTFFITATCENSGVADL